MTDPHQERVVFTGSFYRAGSRGWVIAPFVLAMLALVFLAVNLGVGEEQLPEGLWEATPWFAGALAVFVLLTVLAHFRVVTRVRVVALPGGTGARLELRDRKQASTVAPLRFAAGWHWGQMHTGRRVVQHPVLELAVFDEQGRCPALLREELGTAYQPPEGLPEGTLRAAAEVVLFATFGRVHLDRLAQELDRLACRP